MASPTYTLYKRVPENGEYRYRRAAYHTKNHKIMQDVVFVDGQQVTVPGGRYYMRTKDGWLDAGTDALQAERMRSDMLRGIIPQSMRKPEPTPEPTAVLMVSKVDVPDVPSSISAGCSLADRIRVYSPEEWARLGY